MIENLERLKVFYHVFSQKSVISAANSLHVSQSAVSQSLRKLENEINIPLFTRLHKRLIPTAAGEHLYGVVRPFMEDLGLCLKNLAQSRDQPFGELRIGAPLEFGKAYLPAIVAGFREQYENVTFYLKFGDPGTLLPMVEKGQIDFALVDVFLTKNKFAGNLDIYHFNPVTEEEVILACSRQYYDTFVKKNHSFGHIASQNFISYRHDDQTLRNWFKHHFGKYNVHSQVVLTVDSHQAVISTIKHHAGMGVIASHQVGEDIRRGEIVPINTPKSEIINQISLAILQDKIPTLAEKAFQQFLLERIESLKIGDGLEEK